MAETNVSASQRVLMALREAKNKIETLERYRSEPIAVIGMGCRFPGGDTPAAFWSLLSEGRQAIRNIPPNRFPHGDLYDGTPGTPGKIYIRRGGFLDHVDQFDPYFFRISPREAEGLDPQQRLALEVAWEALAHARLDPSSLAGSPTGVFMGMGQNDYARLKLNSGDLTAIDAYDGSGNLSCFAPGRLGYVLGARGPNLVVDTACSSSLVAVHLACQSLRQQECNMALAGGVHLILSPEITVFLCQTGVLAPDGVCKTFDGAADGFARGEGCGMLVLKRLSDARAMEDNILAVILGSAVNHDGRSGGLTVPNETAQADLIQTACNNAGVSPDDVSYIEAHGTGTSLGDPIEVAGLATVFGGERSHDLVVGSVKTNIGHLEAAAGVAGMIKTILALQHKVIPPHLNFKTPNPNINWQALPMKVPVTCRAWPDDSPRSIAGVSSFGMSGTNAHVILEASPQADSLTRTGDINPGYQRERYWVAANLAGQGPSPLKVPSFDHSLIGHSPIGHPLIGQRLRLPLSYDLRFEAILTPDQPHYIKDHLVFGKTVVPGASHLTAVLTAVVHAHGSRSVILEDVLFINPLVLDETAGRIVQVILTSSPDGAMAFTMVSSGDGGEWMEHVTGGIRLGERTDEDVHGEMDLEMNVEMGGGQKRVIRPDEDVHDRQKTDEILDGDASESVSTVKFYRHLKNAGFDLGPSFQWGEGFQASDDTATCQLLPMDSLGESKDYPIHPGFLDTCFQLLSYFWETRPKDLDTSPYLFVPFSIDRLNFHQPLDKGCRHRCRAMALAHEKNAGDLLLEDGNGRVVLGVEGFRFRRAEKEAFNGQNGKNWREELYGIQWLPSPHDSPGEAPPQTLLIFSNQQSHGLVTGLEGLGHTCIQVFKGDTFERLDDHTYQINPQASGGFLKLFTAISESHGSFYQAVDQMVCLWGMVQGGRYGGELEPLEGVVAVLDLIQAVVKADWPRIPVLNLVTNVGWALEPDKNIPVPVFAPIWGLGRSVLREYPDFLLRLVDLDPTLEEHGGGCLDRILRADDPVTQIAFVQTRRMDAGLAKLKWEAPDSGPLTLNANASYLITGGFGGLGLALARLLVTKGARNIVLCGRSAPSDDAQTAVEKLTEEGARIVARAVNIADEHQVKELLDEIQASLLPLGGIFHAAGIVRDGGLLNQTGDAMAAVMAPKMMGAWHLHKLTRHLNLDYFVLFSSMASLFGAAGQANYAAANSFLDGLAHFRRSLGLVALSVNWGPFSDVGMAARMASDLSAGWKEMAVEPLVSETGMDILFQLMESDVVQAGVLPGKSAAITRMFHGQEGLGPVVQSADGPSDSAEASGSAEAPASGDLMVRLQSASGEDRGDILTRHIKNRVANILKIKSSDRIALRDPLFDAGLDSLMAVALKKELEQDLGQKLSTTLIFDYPTVEALVGFIQEHLLWVNDSPESEKPKENDSPGPETPKGEKRREGSGAVLQKVSNMSDEDVLNALRGGQ
ncbi:MAG: SDR family NAD(P)-dependent oxidoreductase [Desulfobacterium sp.]|nr:SDR family NAD(P)-dependent oxidoreductase [Desulfobacterium sp.]